MKEIKPAVNIQVIETLKEKRKRLKKEARERDKNLKPYGRVTYSVDQVRKLAGMQCPKYEIAAFLGMAESTFYLHLQNNPELENAYKEGKEAGKASLRARQWQLAMQGNTQMLIHLGKNVLEQFDRQKIDQTVTQTQPVINLVLGEENTYEVDKPDKIK